jgi:hypothetical protein
MEGGWETVVEGFKEEFKAQQEIKVLNESRLDSATQFVQVQTCPLEITQLSC